MFFLRLFSAFVLVCLLFDILCLWSTYFLISLSFLTPVSWGPLAMVVIGRCCIIYTLLYWHVVQWTLLHWTAMNYSALNLTALIALYWTEQSNATDCTTELKVCTSVQHSITLTPTHNNIITSQGQQGDFLGDKKLGMIAPLVTDPTRNNSTPCQWMWGGREISFNPKKCVNFANNKFTTKQRKWKNTTKYIQNH